LLSGHSGFPVSPFPVRNGFFGRLGQKKGFPQKKYARALPVVKELGTGSLLLSCTERKQNDF